MIILIDFVETLSGKDTLHDTVGIAYQVVAESSTDNPDFETTSKQHFLSNTTGNKRWKQRRAFEGFEKDLEASHKKPKMQGTFMTMLNDARRKVIPPSLE